MPLIKLGEATVIKPEDLLETSDIVSKADLELNEKMKKFAQDLKKIAPQASDFLYFTAVMMHAAEASLLDDEGNLRKNADGSDVNAAWEKVGGESIKWVCSDPSIKPYKNSNNDIFPESELKKAYHKWVGRPLCLDHKSSSVDMIRGVIVDTYWDEPKKRIIALCALDKKNYPDLARKVTSGYATNVSMGTAVGRAVCTEDGCHRVARVESDFCDHMRKRSCYGEVNLDLSPIELSLVVTGADPKAKVKHIIAKDLSEARKAASALQNYLDGKISLASAEDDAEIGYIKDELAKLNDRVAKLASSLEEQSDSDENDAVGPTNSTAEFKDELLQDGQPLSAPEANISYADVIQDAQSKLSSINQTLNNLSKLSSLHNSEGSTMTNREKTAWWQGTEEPTPGKPQYPVDPGEAQARPQDKHMVGQKPFPEVGPVDGMHPGYESHEGTEEERKRRLQRLAEAERREQIRRAAVEQAKKELEAKGYFQGTEEPTPAGKPQYPVDPGEAQARPQDKHMVGEKPFPEVGKVDGLYGDDLATKEKLSRASLKATFKKAKTNDGGLNKSASSWNVYAGDHLILTASVDEITRGNAETVYEAVATKDFGKSMIKKIVAEGFEAARMQFKGAQEVAPAPAAGGAPAGTPADEGEPVAPIAPEAPEESTVEDVLMKAQDSITEAIEMLGKGDAEIESDAEGLDEAVTAAPREEKGFAKSSLASMRKTVNSMLGEGFKEVIATLEAHKSELDTAKTVLASKYSTMDPQQKAYFLELVEQSVSASKKTTADSKELMEAFVRYAQGTEAVMRKEAQAVITPEAETQDTSTEEAGGAPVEPVFTTENVDEERTDEIFGANDGKPELFPEDEKVVRERKIQETPDKPSDRDRLVPGYEGSKGFEVGKADDSCAEDGCEVKDDEADAADLDLEKLPQNSTVVVDTDGSMEIKAENIDLTTKEGRAMYRTKLAQKGVQFSDMLGKAHPQGGATPEDIAKPEGDLLKVERIDEVSKAMNDLANMPPKVRKQAQEIVQLVNEGKIAKDEVDQLVSLGVDKDAVSYYKKYFAEAKDSESNEFAKLLTQEKMKASAAADLEVQTVKIKRAHDLAYQMRDKGMIETSQIPQQVDEIMSWNDQGFNSVKNIVAKQEVISKTASVPQVGLLHSEELILPSAAPAVQGGAELSAVLEAHFAGKRL